MAQNSLVGHTLGQYVVMEQLGRGGMADVYKAFHPQLEVYRAIKVIRPEFVTADDFRSRFQKEAQSVAGLRHPNIVQIHDFGEQDDAYYMVMEFVAGQDLKRIIRENGKLRPIRRAVDIVDQIAGALHYAHSQGLIHRDIKPENIMINEDGLPILMDFGIAKLLTASTQLTQTGIGVGTPAYMAPEQAKALPEIGPEADIYSLSVVLYEMLTGEVPYSADTPMAVVLKALNDPMPLPRKLSDDISESLQQVVLKGATKDANNRYATARQFQDALHRALEDEAPEETPAATEIVEPPVAEAESKASPAAPQKRGVQALAAVLLVAGVGVVSYFLLAPDGEDPAGSRLPQSAESTGQTSQADTASTTEEPSDESTASPGDEAQQSVKLIEEATRTEAGQALEFQVDANPGDVVYLQIYEASETTDFTLVTPDGREEVFDSYRNHGPVTLDTGGDYTLTALTRGERTADIDFALWLLRPAVVEGGALQPGRFTHGQTAVPGQSVSYTLEAQNGQTFFFDLAESSETTDFTLVAPDGRTEVFSSYRDQGPFTLEQSGTYTLTADPRDDETSEFDFNLWHVDPAVVDGGVLQTGQYTQGKTSIAGQVVSYTLEAQADQTFFFDLAESSETTDFTLTAPDGRTEVFSSYRDQGPFTLEQSGTYTLTADPRDDETSEFDFNLWHVDPAVIEGGALELGRYIQGKTSVPGQTVSYTLDGQAGQTLFFDLADATETTDFTLIAPDGRTQVFESYRDEGPMTLEQSGTYTLLADPRDDETSEFELNIWNVEPAIIDGGTLRLGEYVQGETSIPGQRASYSLEAQGGETIHFDLAESSNTTDFTLTAPDGHTEVFSSYRDAGPFKLEQGGTYRLQVDPRDDDTAAFEFALKPE